MRLGRLILTAPAAADLGRALLWLSQPGSGSSAAARLASLTRALHGLPEAPFRWPIHRESANLRRRSIRGGIVVLYRVLHDEPDCAPGEVVVEVLAIVGSGQSLEGRIPWGDPS